MPRLHNPRTERLEFRMSFPVGGDVGANDARLEVTDIESGTRILEAQLTPTDLAGLLAGRGCRVDAEVVNPEGFATVGKTYVHTTVDVPDPLSRDTDRTADRYTPKPTQAVLDWADANAPEGEWEGRRFSFHNYGWTVHYHRYEARA